LDGQDDGLSALCGVTPTLLPPPKKILVFAIRVNISICVY